MRAPSLFGLFLNLVLMLGMSGLLACNSGDGTDPSISVSPEFQTVIAGGSATFRYSVSNFVEPGAPAVSVSDPAIAEIVGIAGDQIEVRGISEGQTTITVLHVLEGGKVVRGEARLNVLPAGTPVITGVAPLTGVAGEMVTLSATVLSETPLTYEWDLRGLGAGVVTTESPTFRLPAISGPSQRIGATVRVRNAVGESTPFNFVFTVTPAPGTVPTIESVTPTGSIGLQGQTKTFSAVVSAEAGATYQWDFGFGTSPGTSTEASPTVTLGGPGTFSGSLVVTDSRGASETFRFTYRVQGPQGVYTFSGISSGFDNQFDTATVTSAALYKGRPIVAFHVNDGTVNEVRVAQAQVDFPTSSADWFTSVVATPDTSGLPAGQPQLKALSADEIACILTNSATDTAIGRTTVDRPDGVGSWTFTEGPPTFVPTFPGAFSVLGDRMVLGSATATGLELWVANSATPALAADWTSHVITTEVTFAWTGNIVVREDETPMACGYKSGENKPMLFLCTEPLPDATSDWVAVEVAPGEANAAPVPQVNVVEVNDRIGVTYSRLLLGGSTPRQEFALSTGPNPASAADFNVSNIEGTVGGFSSMIVIDDRVLVGYSGSFTPEKPVRVASATITDTVSIAAFVVNVLENVSESNRPDLLLSPFGFSAYYADPATGEIRQAITDNP